MAETLSYANQSTETTEPQMSETGQPQAEARSSFLDTLDTGAGILLRKKQMRLVTAAMEGLDGRQDGLLGRRMAPDLMSLALSDSIFVEFQRGLRQAGYADSEGMSREERAAVAQEAITVYAADIVAELEVHHPDWAPQQIEAEAAVQAADAVTLLSMGSEEFDAYSRDLLDYQQLHGQAKGVEEEIESLRATHKEQLRDLGRTAVTTLVRLVNTARDLPHKANVNVILARERVASWYTNKSPEGKKTVIATAFGIAVTGLATYLAVRLGAGADHQPQGGGFQLVSAESLDTGGVPNPETVGSSLGGGIPNPEDVSPSGNGGVPNPEIVDPSGNSETPNPETVDPSGNSNVPNPEDLFKSGHDLSGAKMTEELFGNGHVTTWPETVVVSKWDPTTKDGSLWGISTEMLQRSGVSNPDTSQIDALVDALGPQAQPDGQLLKGQTLHLGPAIRLLPKV